jgi:hypothetical protein
VEARAEPDTACRMATLVGAAFVLALSPPTDLIGDRGLSRLLTQRAVQQVIHLNVVSRDEVQGRWLGQYQQREDGRGVSPDFHGIDALPTSDSASYVCGLLALPTTLIGVRRRNMPMGGSPNNPYLKDRRAFEEVPFEIKGVAVAQSVMAMRAALAAEWEQDVALFACEDAALVSRHRQAMAAGAAGSARNAAAVSAATASTLPTFEAGRLGGDSGRSSPFRLATYDLLKLLATRQALLSVLDELSGGDGRFGGGRISDGSGRGDPRRSRRRDCLVGQSREEAAASAEWLERFWEARKAGFYGHRPWAQGEQGATGPADALVWDLLAAEPSVVPGTGGSGGVLIDPPRLAEAMLEVRSEVAEEWRGDVALVAEEHLCWRRWHLERGGEVS